MARSIVIDPITRISGFLEITVKIENNKISDVKTSGLLYRGFEKILENRSPLDAVYLTERICGICSAAHSLASSIAIENAIGIEPDTNDQYLRDIIHGFEFIQNHLRQFYLYTVPSYVRLPHVSPLSQDEYIDFRIPENLEKKISDDYIIGIDMSRLAHEGQAVLGGKAPHNHGIFVGGVNLSIDAYKISKVKSIIKKLSEFISHNMLEDINIISHYYPDYFHIGGSYPNYLSFGVFDSYKDKDISYIRPRVMINDKLYSFNRNKIGEDIYYSYYEDEDVNADKKDSYTFIKAARYDGLPMEVGPLARLILCKEYENRSSCMDRNMARVLETLKIIRILNNLIYMVDVKENNQKQYDFSGKFLGYGLTDTTRGALYHSIEIENSIIKKYNIITPTGWNLSPKSSDGFYGTGEEAMLGTEINDINNPIEIGRIIRSYDPCVSCGTHVIGPNIKDITIRVV